MKRHECPTCGQCYGCSRAECGSPLVYDCFFCYVTRFAKELEDASGEVAERFGFRNHSSASPDGCYAN